MKELVILEKILEPDSWEKIETEDILEAIISRYPELPPNVKFYYNEISDATDITPTCPDEISLLAEQDRVIMVLYPGATAVIVAIVAVVVGVAVAYFMMPSVPSVGKNTVQQSPNNELTGRTNKPRPNARIPDIFGTVRSTPDLIAQPFSIFINHQEVEHCFMCLGRGEYNLNSNKIYDHTTLFSEVAGASLEVYAPFTSPNSGDVPQLSIGDPINRRIDTVYKANSVNGQTLRSPNSNNYRGSGNLRFVAPNIIEASENTQNFDFTRAFNADDDLKIEGVNVATGYVGQVRTIRAHSPNYFMFEIPSNQVPAEFANGGAIRLTGALFEAKDSNGYVTSTYDLSGTYTASSISVVTTNENTGTVEDPVYVTKYYLKIELLNANLVNPKWNVADGVTTTSANVLAETNTTKLSLDGVYKITSVSQYSITLSNPSAVNPNWSQISTTEWTSGALSVSGPRWIGPFTATGKDITGMYLNFVASNGLFKDNGENQVRVDVTIEAEVTQVNEAGNAIAAPTLHQYTVEGSDVNRSQRAGTLEIQGLTPGRYKVRVRRVTPTDLNYKGSVVDEVKWRELYSLTPVDDLHFGNVTTLQVVNYATTGALTLKERKVNLESTRLVYSVDSNFNLLPYKIPSNKAGDIFVDLSLDPFIGRRNIAELNLQAIYNTVNEIENYFGTAKAAEFCYTFDKTNLTYENSAAIVANAIYCEAFRQGNLIQLFFERKTNDTVLLFNHRNKLPDSEKRHLRFGNLDDYNGVVYSFTDPENEDTLSKIILSDIENEEPNNPKEIEGVGVRNRLQAYFHAQRMWSKIKNQNLTCTFNATQEGEVLLKGHRILNSDSTSNFTQEGYIRNQELLVLTLSQDFVAEAGVNYNINLQLTDGTVENIQITPTSNKRQVILQRAPSIPLNLDPSSYNDSRYIIYPRNSINPEAFIVSERKTNDNMTTTVNCYNYSELYYSADSDYISGIVNESGYKV